MLAFENSRPPVRQRLASSLPSLTFWIGRPGAMLPDALFRRYQDLQAYVGWCDADVRRSAAGGPVHRAAFQSPHRRFLCRNPATSRRGSSHSGRHRTNRAIEGVSRIGYAACSSTITTWTTSCAAGRWDFVTSKSASTRPTPTWRYRASARGSYALEKRLAWRSWRIDRHGAVVEQVARPGFRDHRVGLPDRVPTAAKTI